MWICVFQVHNSCRDAFLKNTVIFKKWVNYLCALEMALHKRRVALGKLVRRFSKRWNQKWSDWQGHCKGNQRLLFSTEAMERMILQSGSFWIWTWQIWGGVGVRNKDQIVAPCLFSQKQPLPCPPPWLLNSAHLPELEWDPALFTFHLLMCSQQLMQLDTNIWCSCVVSKIDLDIFF